MMTRLEAQKIANRLFDRRQADGPAYNPAIGDRYAFSSLGRKSNPDRCMIGYDQVVDFDIAADSKFAKTQRVLLGRGPTWEIALERAMKYTPCKNCEAPADDDGVCSKCRRDPAINNCTACGRHLSGINYPYVCGTCTLMK